MKPSRIEAKVDLGYLPAGKSFLTQLLRRYIICSKFELFKNKFGGKFSFVNLKIDTRYFFEIINLIS